MCSFNAGRSRLKFDRFVNFIAGKWIYSRLTAPELILNWQKMILALEKSVESGVVTAENPGTSRSVSNACIPRA